MTEQDFEKKLSDLIAQIDGLPTEQKEQLQVLAEETKARQAKIRKTMKDLQDSLDYLRLSVKYMVFDLEATRRENEYLRKMLEKSNNGGND